MQIDHEQVTTINNIFFILGTGLRSKGRHSQLYYLISLEDLDGSCIWAIDFAPLGWIISNSRNRSFGKDFATIGKELIEWTKPSIT